MRMNGEAMEATREPAPKAVQIANSFDSLLQNMANVKQTMVDMGQINMPKRRKYLLRLLSRSAAFQSAYESV
jgi:hypothetical protein